MLKHVRIVTCVFVEAVYEVYQQRDGPFSRALLSSAVRKIRVKSPREIALENKVRELSEAYRGLEIRFEDSEKDFEEKVEAAAALKISVLQMTHEECEKAMKQRHEQAMRQKDIELDKKGKENAALRSQLKIVNARSAGQTEKAGKEKR